MGKISLIFFAVIFVFLIFVQESLAAAKQASPRKPNPTGTNKATTKKANKKPKPANPNVVRWKGKSIVIGGATASDPPEQAQQISEKLKSKSKSGKSCRVKPPKIVSDIHPGPKGEGAGQSDFQPCSEQKRGEFTKHNANKKPHKVGKKAPKTVHARSRRSESYAATNWLWADPENIPFILDPKYPDDKRQSIIQAMEMWENYTCVRFAELTPTPLPNSSYAFFSQAGGSVCSTSQLGPNFYAPFTTVVDLTPCSDLTGTISHEIGHMIGLTHAQKRIDRDRYLTFYANNTGQTWLSQFDKDDHTYFTDFGTPFYYDSIMQYFPYAATTNKQMTLCPADPLMEVLMGQRQEPAFGDIGLVNKLYCQESCFNRSNLGKPFNANLSVTIGGRTCQSWASQTPHKHSFGHVGNHSYCRNPDNWEGGPWCYTNEPTIPYEPCFSACEDLTAWKKPFCEGWCYNGGHHDPDTCKCRCPAYSSGVYCEKVNETLFYDHLECGGKIVLNSTRPQAQILSPNFGASNYPANQICAWWINVPIGYRVKTDFVAFSLESADSTGCLDYLEIRSSICATAFMDPDKMRYCGNSLAPDNIGNQQIISDSNDLVLKFITDEIEQEKGFSVVVSIVSV